MGWQEFGREAAREQELIQRLSQEGRGIRKRLAEAEAAVKARAATASSF